MIKIYSFGLDMRILTWVEGDSLMVGVDSFHGKPTILFKKRFIEKILAGEKTQTRRLGGRRYKVGGVYAVRDGWSKPVRAYIRITRCFTQRLGDISPEDVEKEGFKSFEEFVDAWVMIYGSWDPEQIVTCYEFEIVEVRGTG